MNDELTIREMSRTEAREHYQWLRDRLFLVRAQYAGTLNACGARLLTRSQLAARVALSRAGEERG